MELLKQQNMKYKKESQFLGAMVSLLATLLVQAVTF